MRLLCTQGAGSRMFSTGAEYEARQSFERTYEVTDNLGHPRILVVEDGKAKFCVRNDLGVGQPPPSLPVYAKFEVLQVLK